MSVLFILDHTFFHDLYRDDYPCETKETTKKFNDYLIIKQAVERPNDKIAMTSSEVFDTLLNKTQINTKTKSNMWLATEDYIEISNLTKSHPNIMYKEATKILTIVEATSDKRRKVILISNSSKAEEKIVEYIKNSLKDNGRDVPHDFGIEKLPFKVMNTSKALDYLKENDTEMFKMV